MPQADLHYTADQSPRAREALAEIETLLRAYDASAGECKGRAHRIDDYHHAHMLLRVSMLAKPHRDAAYAEELGRRLAELLRPHATAPCAINVHIEFNLEHYTSLKLD